MSHVPAPLELRDFIAATRPDWAPLEIQQTISRAQSDGWTYEHFVGALIRTAWDDDASPRDVDHMRPKTQPRPETWLSGGGATS